jgi:hypothetical protein
MADPRFSDIYSQVSPNAQSFLNQAGMGQTDMPLMTQGGAVDAIIEALQQGQEYDFLNNFDLGSPDGIQGFMGTMAGVSGQISPDQRKMLEEQVKRQMLGQMTNETVGNRPLQQHAMGQMLNKALQVGAPMPDPRALQAQQMPQMPTPQPTPSWEGDNLIQRLKEQEEMKRQLLQQAGG